VKSVMNPKEQMWCR